MDNISKSNNLISNPRITTSGSSNRFSTAAGHLGRKFGNSSGTFDNEPGVTNPVSHPSDAGDEGNEGNEGDQMDTKRKVEFYRSPFIDMRFQCLCRRQRTHLSYAAFRAHFENCACATQHILSRINGARDINHRYSRILLPDEVVAIDPDVAQDQKT
ncbi:hypothetical protein B0O80DRAFT_501193 [Mortierella sp. GBAus27b]|nr:hypothetical protein B0O80DRAFT_501193 [Mortierella sp. GBAus27b]